MGQFVRAIDAIPGAVTDVRGHLASVRAGQSQLRWVGQLADMAAEFAAEGERIIKAVDGIELPLIAEIENAGGPREVADLGYYGRV
jgi:hypothetical protein